MTVSQFHHHPLTTQSLICRSSPLRATIWPNPSVHFHAVRDGERGYMSGHAAQDPATGKLIEDGVAAQTEQIFHNLKVILEAADKTLADVVKVNVYLMDIKRFTDMNEVYARHFVAPYPARTTVAVAALPLNAEVEMETIAS